MPVKNTGTESPVAGQTAALGQDMAARTGVAKDAMSEIANTAAEKLDSSRTAAADRLDDAAAAVSQRAADLPGGEKVRDLAHAAADRLSTTADYVRSHDMNRMMADVESVVKNNPGPALLVAAAFGFLLGRALTRD